MIKIRQDQDQDQTKIYISKNNNNKTVKNDKYFKFKFASKSNSFFVSARYLLIIFFQILLHCNCFEQVFKNKQKKQLCFIELTCIISSLKCNEEVVTLGVTNTIKQQQLGFFLLLLCYYSISLDRCGSKILTRSSLRLRTDQSSQNATDYKTLTKWSDDRVQSPGPQH